MGTMGISKILIGEINIAFGTEDKLDLNRIKNGVALWRTKTHVATVYWSNIKEQNKVEIAIAPAKFSDYHKPEIVTAWLLKKEEALGTKHNEHLPGSGWITVGLQNEQIAGFLSELRFFRKNPTLSNELQLQLKQWLLTDSETAPPVSRASDAPNAATQYWNATTEQSISNGQMFVSHFGEHNYLWNECRQHSVIATFQLEALLSACQDNDLAAFSRIAEAMSLKSTRGKLAVQKTMTDWFNVSRRFLTSSQDLWLHSDDQDLWWTTTLSDAASIRKSERELEMTPGAAVIEILKNTKPWSRHDLQGRPLHWHSLHPKARNFLSPQATMHAPAEEHRDYVRALLCGQDLSHWHSRQEWRQVADEHATKLVVPADAIEKEAMTMALQAKQTADGANGQETTVIVKNKEVRFPTTDALAAYVQTLIAQQNGLCAISGIALQFRGMPHDENLLCSLDRIDSNGHYERGNLQVVCRFVNFWKRAEDDLQFRQLLQLVCTTNKVNLSRHALTAPSDAAPS